MENQNKEELLTIKEVSNILKVTPVTLKRWEGKHKIHPIRINSRGDRRYPKWEVINIMIGAIDCNACDAYQHQQVAMYCPDHQEKYDQYIKRLG